MVASAARRPHPQARSSGTAERPRLIGVPQRQAHLRAGRSTTSTGKTLAHASTLAKDAQGRSCDDTDKKAERAKQVGDADRQEAAKAKGIDKVVFDRNGYLYHGRVKALADGAREAGLKF